MDDDFFIHGYAFHYWMCQLFLSECVLFLSHSVWHCHYGFLTFPFLVGDKFSSQMISGTVSWLLGLDRIFK